MFCANCGEKISDSSKFCRFCGAKTEMDSVSALHTGNELEEISHQRLNTVFNRDVLNQYLYNIRYLEVAKNKLIIEQNSIKNRIDSLGYSRINSRQYYADHETTIYLWIFVAVVVVIELIAGKLLNWLFDMSWGVVIALIAAAIIFGVILTAIFSAENAEEKREHMQNVYADDFRVAKELEEKENLTAYLTGLEKEITEISDLLDDAYSINIIPSKFRNVYAAYFLYDFISTSTATLNEALLHCDLDTIQQKLDEVIRQQEAMIMELAYQNALSQQVIQQNGQMLEYAIQTENNTALAAQYNKIAANNTSIVAAIQMSEYLKP